MELNTGCKLLRTLLFLFLAVSFLFSSCSKKTPGKKSEEEKSVEFLNVPAGENQSFERDVVEREGESKKINWDLISPYFGTYLPEIYLNNLRKFKSHVKASDEFALAVDNCPNVIVLNEKGVSCNFNFHEGASFEILENDADSMLVKDFFDNKEYRLENKLYILVDGVKYKKIHESREMDSEVISSFLTEELLPKMELKDGKNSFYVDGSVILYNNEKYFYGTSLVFVGHKYDHIGQELYSSERYIEILDNQINIYRAYPKENESDIGWEENAVYEMESSFHIPE